MEATGVVNKSPASVGTTADASVTQNTGRKYLFIQNLHSTAKVYVRIDQTTKAGGTAVVAVAGAAGTICLPPLASLTYETKGFIPSGALSIISDTAATPVTILEG